LPPYPASLDQYPNNGPFFLTDSSNVIYNGDFYTPNGFANQQSSFASVNSAFSSYPHHLSVNPLPPLSTFQQDTAPPNYNDVMNLNHQNRDLNCDKK
jgi:hypothetical protein